MLEKKKRKTKKKNKQLGPIECQTFDGFTSTCLELFQFIMRPAITSGISFQLICIGHYLQHLEIFKAYLKNDFILTSLTMTTG